MLFEDTYKTISKASEGTFRDRGSKFLGYAFPIGSEAEIRDIIATLKADHPKARHYCWAMRLSPDRSVFRLNDDGEPSGTAGRPILNTLLSQDLTDILMVVVRYFGGTLLGVPGLINAYKKASLEALQNAEVTEKTVNSLYEINFGHNNMNELMRIVKEEDLKIKSQHFDNNCRVELEIRHSAQERILERLKKISGLSFKFIFSR
jgi:uncharacterized YigZ family protein